ncbi:albusnodin/ikarugamycin family macrolactam cyclase [Streptomyces sp. NPDC000594]|uniref:albusnodin/ikarugamycin family macrolactam cyclase n=1 Tax=Streptomyces sp. NPDC000594 TaxID=3154261 RepID=UPI0033254F3A
MRWSAGWRSTSGAVVQRPRGGRAVPGTVGVWTVGWPSDRIRSVSDEGLTLTVIGECGAAVGELKDALRHVREHRWHALTRWPGSYLTVAARGSLTAVVGDLSGQHPVYWRTLADGVWWSTAATPLAALDRTGPDPVALAAHLAHAQPDTLRRSLFGTVRRVPTGWVLLLDDGGARTRAYEPVEYPQVDIETGAHHLARTLLLAVSARLGEHRAVSSDLAGLDSTTLACLAAQHRPVTAVTFTDDRIGDDDLAHARRTVAAVPRISHRLATGSEHTVMYEGLSHPPTDTPTAYTVTAAIKRATLAPVAPQGPGVHFIGEAGDCVLSASSCYLADLWRTGPRRHAWRHTVAHARLSTRAPLTVLHRTLPAARGGLADSWHRAAALLRGAPRPWIPQAERYLSWTPLLAGADWMAPELRRRLADALDERAAHLSDGPDRIATWWDRQDLARIGADLTGWRSLVEADHGPSFELAAPYLDNEVIRAALAVPAHRRGAPDRYKPLLSAAFPAGPVPSFVLERVTKGGFNGMSYAGFRRNAAALRTLLGPGSRLADLGLITPAPVREQLDRAVAGQPAAQGALHLAVSAEVWLRQLSTSTDTWWAGKGAANRATA